MTREEKIKKILESEDDSKAVNRMGCSENWYDPYYAIKHTFEEDDIKTMTESELDDLFKLASTISEYLY